MDVVQACFHFCVGPTTWVWLLVRPSTPSFYLSPAHFFITFCISFCIPHLIVAHLPQCQCGHTIDDLGIHMLCCACESECTITHDTL